MRGRARAICLIIESLVDAKMMDADTALRLAHCFGTSVDFRTGIQAHSNTERAKMALADRPYKSTRMLDSDF